MKVNLSLTWTLLILVANSSLSKCSYAVFTSVSRCWTVAFSRSWMFSASTCFATLTPFTPLSPVSIHYEKITRPSLANAGLVSSIIIWQTGPIQKRRLLNGSMSGCSKFRHGLLWRTAEVYALVKCFYKAAQGTKESSLLLSTCRISFSVYLYWRRSLFMNGLLRNNRKYEVKSTVILCNLVYVYFCFFIFFLWLTN